MMRNWRLRRWVRKLESPYRRLKACTKLGQLGDARAIEPLITRLGDRDSAVQQAACRALGQLGDARAIEPLIAHLGDRWDSALRQAACRALGQLGDTRAIEPLIARLGNRDVQQAAKSALVAIGPATVAPLVAWLRGGSARESQEAAGQVISAITQSLEPHLNWLLCRFCLTRFARRTYTIGKRTTSHYIACRLCLKAADVMRDVKEAVAVLDAEMHQEFTYANGVVRVNWLRRETLCDFDRVEIIQTTEYEVERLCIQVGNDTDTFRQPRYRRMACIVAPQYDLPQSALNMLKRTFGEVSVGPITPQPGDCLC
jgi:hypothetical protein